MKMSEEIKKQILNGFIDIFTRIANKEFQRRIWINGEGPECQAFDDAVCDFFDIGDPILEDYKAFGITKTQYKQLKKLRDKFRLFADENDFPEEFIDTPEWANIINMAKEVLKAFNYQKD